MTPEWLQSTQKQTHFRQKGQSLPFATALSKEHFHVSRIWTSACSTLTLKLNPSCFPTVWSRGPLVWSWGQLLHRAGPATFPRDPWDFALPSTKQGWSRWCVSQIWTIFDNTPTCENKFADFFHFSLKDLQKILSTSSLEEWRRDSKMKKKEKFICMHFAFFSRYLQHLPFLMWNTNFTKHVSTMVTRLETWLEAFHLEKLSNLFFMNLTQKLRLAWQLQRSTRIVFELRFYCSCCRWERLEGENCIIYQRQHMRGSSFSLVFDITWCHFKTSTAFLLPVLYWINFNNNRLLQAGHKLTVWTTKLL